MGRRSIFDIIQVTRSVRPKLRDSAMYPKAGGSSEPGFGGGAGWSLWPIILTQKAIAAKMAMKMSRLQPARRPSLPMKILRKVEGCGGGTSVAIGVASGFKWVPHMPASDLRCEVVRSLSCFCSGDSEPCSRCFPLSSKSRAVFFQNAAIHHYEDSCLARLLGGFRVDHFF